MCAYAGHPDYGFFAPVPASQVLHGREELSLLSFVCDSEGHIGTVSLPCFQHSSYYGCDELLSFACGLLEGHIGKASTASRWYQHPS